jgi:hypothetical protein
MWVQGWVWSQLALPRPGLGLHLDAYMAKCLTQPCPVSTLPAWKALSSLLNLSVTHELEEVVASYVKKFTSWRDLKFFGLKCQEGDVLRKWGHESHAWLGRHRWTPGTRNPHAAETGFLFCCFCFCGAGDGTQVLTHARQVCTTELHSQPQIEL